MRNRSLCVAAAVVAISSVAFGQATKPAEKAPADTGGSGALVKGTTIAEGGNETKGFDMAPETNLAVVEAAVRGIPVPMAKGEIQPSWDSLKAHYKVPAWFAEARFGIFMHWGLYTVPAYHNEWYEKHMYASALKWHTENFGDPEVFGYKDFIPKFTAAKWDPAAWAELFEKAGAKYVIPTAEHHENFANWDSDVTPFNSVKMGPHRDLIGDLSKAVRARGLKFGVSNHGIENFTFINPTKELRARLEEKKADLFDPKWADFYNVADRSDEACRRFLINWAMRNAELIDKYQPDMLWFDNGVDQRYLDPIKLWVAAYYYNRASEWGKEVSLSTKKAAYAPSGTNVATIGSIIDFEKIGARSPSGIRTGDWQVDDPIGSTWGYTTGMRISAAPAIIGRLVDTVSKNGNYLLNISPQADGTISEEQQATLLAVGAWLKVNGEAIYGTHAWTQYGDGEDARGRDAVLVRFTVKGEALYVILTGNVRPGAQVTVKSLGTSAGAMKSATMLGTGAAIVATQSEAGLTVKLPEKLPAEHGVVVKVMGIKVNPPPMTADGNPVR